MKKLLSFLLLIGCFACVGDKSHTETAQVVVESFFDQDTLVMQTHTTSGSYRTLMEDRELIAVSETRDPEFRILQDSVRGETAWVKFTTAYQEEPQTFKLVKEDGRWKVSEIGKDEVLPF